MDSDSLHGRSFWDEFRLQVLHQVPWAEEKQQAHRATTLRDQQIQIPEWPGLSLTLAFYYRKYLTLLGFRGLSVLCKNGAREFAKKTDFVIW